MKLRIGLITALGMLGATGAHAHGVWTESRQGHLEVVYGHGAEDEAYAPEKIKGVWAYDQGGKMVPVKVERLTDHARLKPLSAPAVVTVALDNGVWSKKNDGTSINAPMKDVPGSTSSSHSYKYSLAVLQPHARIPESLKIAMAIRPLKDPTEVGVGNPLPVLVTIDGKPAANIDLLDDYRGMLDVSSTKTDADGKASIIVRNAGLNIIAAQAKVPSSNETDVSVRSLFTSLTFVGTGHHH